MTSVSEDVVETVLGASPDLVALRRQRAELTRLTQTSYQAALRPRQPHNFSYAERAAFACRIATLRNGADLTRYYRELLAQEGTNDELDAIANPASDHEFDARMSTILRHIDMVTLDPRAAAPSDISALRAAGLDDRDIVTLAGIIAFVNYQLLVVGGLALLRDN